MALSRNMFRKFAYALARSKPFPSVRIDEINQWKRDREAIILVLNANSNKDRDGNTIFDRDKFIKATEQ